MRNFKITKQITKKEAPSFDKYLKEISKIKLLTPDQEVELINKARQGDQKAMQQLVSANLKFVISVAKQYQGQGLSLPDLISEGNIGLIQAVEKFDETYGFRFLTYAVWWVRQSIIEGLGNHSRTVRIPLNKVNTLRKINKAKEELEQSVGGVPTSQDIADRLGISRVDVNDVLSAGKTSISMDIPVADDSAATMCDLLEGNQDTAPDQGLHEEVLKGQVQALLKGLPDRKRDIIVQFFGLEGNFPKSLDELANKYSISKERVRQLKLQALDHIKNKGDIEYLKAYLNEK